MAYDIYYLQIAIVTNYANNYVRINHPFMFGGIIQILMAFFVIFSFTIK